MQIIGIPGWNLDSEIDPKLFRSSHRVALGSSVGALIVGKGLVVR